MATGGLYGSSLSGTLVAQPGTESVGLYGNSVPYGGTYFEWFIFQESATQPATPTGGSWNFTTNVGTPPTGWTTVPPALPTLTVWASITFVNSKTGSTFTWSTPATWVKPGTPGTSGYSGFSGFSGYSGYGLSGFSGYSGYSGYSGSGVSGYSGYSGSGTSGYSGFSGISGFSGYSGISGYSGATGASGASGYSGSGISGYSGYSGFSGSGATVYPGSGIPLSTGSAWSTSYPTTGATSVVLRDAYQNISANSITEGFSNVAAAGTTTTLAVGSVPNFVVTGSGGQTYKLPDATTLANGVNYTFNNNQSSGTIVVTNNSGTTISTVQSGGFVEVILLSNATVAGSWDVHNFAPSNVSWSTNTFDYPGSITSATWNGTTVAINRGGTGLTSVGTSGYVLTSNGSAMLWAASTGGSAVGGAAYAWFISR